MRDEEIDLEYWQLLNEYHDSLENNLKDEIEKDPFTGSLEDYGLSWSDFL